MHDAVEACVVTGANLGQPLASLGQHLNSINATLDPHVPGGGGDGVDGGQRHHHPTFKVKRKRIEAIYAAHYERWEASGQKVIWQAA